MYECLLRAQLYAWLSWILELHPSLLCADGVGPAANAGGGGSIGIGVLGMVMLAQTVYVSDVQVNNYRVQGSRPVIDSCFLLELLPPRCVASHTCMLCCLAAICALTAVVHNRAYGLQPVPTKNLESMASTLLAPDLNPKSCLQVGVYIPNAPPNYKEMVNQFDFFSGDIRHDETTNREQTLMRMQRPNTLLSSCVSKGSSAAQMTRMGVACLPICWWQVGVCVRIQCSRVVWTVEWHG